MKTRSGGRMGWTRGLGLSLLAGLALTVLYQSIARRAQGAAEGQKPGDQRSISSALAGLDVAKGVEAQIFAAEPMLLNPTDIDIDHRGRVWVCEVVNYRRRKDTRPKGDRILILEDEDGDGKADTTKVFYQGRDIDSALGICVLGNKVIVSCAPNIYLFTDTDGDDKADTKELLFTKTGQAQHDHSAHAFVFGPDGKLYWNFGNTGKGVHDKNGKPVVDKEGNQVLDRRQPYIGGMVFRCNLDGSDFEVLGHNFRNNYEVAVDSFGTLWQSDNDDDGNRGVRINYVMEHGNFGYRDELTGAGWRSERIGMHKEIPIRHWHQNDPGVIPNMIGTGAGSPTGICVYEADLLPKRFWNEVLHCDAGPNVVRAYPATPDGAGYKATMENLLVGTRDKWFRPSDVAVAPDGSVIVADWYDPGVGGHRMGDVEKGRLFRLAPPETPYKIKQLDFETLDGLIEGLKNPNLATRYIVWTKLHEMGEKAEKALVTLFKTGKPRHQARALWLLGKIKGKEHIYIKAGLENPNPDLRITALRLAKQESSNLVKDVESVIEDKSPAVRREAAVTLRDIKGDQAVDLWVKLAKQYDGKDRWYLEALGLAADGRWQKILPAWQKVVSSDWKNPANANIIWRSRSPQTAGLIVQLLNDSKAVPDAEVPRFLRALDFQPPEAVSAVWKQWLTQEHDLDDAREAVLARQALLKANDATILSKPNVKTMLKLALKDVSNVDDFIALVRTYKVQEQYPELLKRALADPQGQDAIKLVKALFNVKQQDMMAKSLTNKDLKIAVPMAEALGTSADGRAVPMLEKVLLDTKAPMDVRRSAAASLTASKRGAERLVKLAQDGKFDKRFSFVVGSRLQDSNWGDIKKVSVKLFPVPVVKGTKPLPSMKSLLRLKANANNGKVVFTKHGKCNTCHKVRGEGKEVGPDLSEIGSKLSREAMFESILAPSAGISHNYETHMIVTVDGDVIKGIIISETPEEIVVKTPKALERKIAVDEIEAKKKDTLSLMPADLAKDLTPQEIADVVGYLRTLKKK